MHIWLLFCFDCQYYLLSSDSELTIERGDKVLVTDMLDKHRWKGSVDQNEGWFPSWVFDSKQKSVSKHELQPSQATDLSSSHASCYQHEQSVNTQLLSSIQITTGEAENTVSSGSIDSVLCRWESGDLVGWLKHIGFYDFRITLGKHGVTDLPSAAAVTEQQLEKAGIRKPGRINKFLQESAKLKAGKIVNLFVERLLFITCFVMFARISGRFRY